MKRKNVEAWPSELLQLQQIYQSLCTICTFLSSRKHVVTTIDMIKGPVERETGRDLQHSDLAKIRHLLPHDVRFQYIDINETIKEQDVYAPEDGKTQHVLVFEFVDGQLKPEKKPGGRKKTDLSVPTFSVQEMKKMIEKRRAKFSSAVEEFLRDYAVDKDAIAALDEGGNKLMPVKPEFVDPLDMMGIRRSPGTSPDARPSIQWIIDEQLKVNGYHGQIVEDGEYTFDNQPPVYGHVDVDKIVLDAIDEARGITQFYTHQAQAINAIHEGKHVIVSTSTSSGKSLIYQIPVLENLISKESTAIYIFPTKALAQDQRNAFSNLVQYVKPGTIIDTYDGDTPKSLRNEIRATASVIFTNPDMIHTSILPTWRLWAPFLRKLKILVVDELHVYNGLFGSNVSMVMRRLRRICAMLGNHDLQFVSCSATVNNPVQMMETVFGVEDNVELVDQDGSPHGQRHVLMWNTPYMSPNDPTSGRVNPIGEAANIFIQLISQNVKTLVFCRVRRVCELLIKSIRQRLGEDHDLLGRVMSYRGGYSAPDRRKIESQMFNGHLLGIVATNALELGIDIGNLDAVVVCGFPFTISNFRQQIGRAGRRNRDSLAVLIGGGGAVDQHYMRHPRDAFEASNPEVAIDLENSLMLEGHLQCAAYESPLTDSDEQYFGDWKQHRERLVKGQFGYEPHDKFLPWPSDNVSIRGAEEEYHAVVDITNNRNVVIEQVERSRVFFTLYEGGIFLHQGYPYLVQDFDFDGKLAKVMRVNVDWHTKQRDYTDIDPLGTKERKRVAASRTRFTANYGTVRIKTVVFGYFKMDRREKVLDAVEIDQRPFEFDSMGFWINVPGSTLQKLKSHNLNMAGAIHGAEHALLNLIPQFVSLLPSEMGTECKNKEKEFSKRESSRKRPARLIFFDRQCGGTGISAKAFEHAETLLSNAIEIIDACKCEYGCPACICSEGCLEESIVVSKTGARVILGDLAGLPLSTIPMGPEPNLRNQPTHETVVEATTH